MASHQIPRRDYAAYRDISPYPAPGEHEAQRQASIRAWEALMLAETPESWSQLLQGQPVPIDQLDTHAIARLRKRKAA